MKGVELPSISEENIEFVNTHGTVLNGLRPKDLALYRSHESVEPIN